MFLQHVFHLFNSIAVTQWTYLSYTCNVLLYYVCCISYCLRCWISSLEAYIGSVYVPMAVSLIYNFVILGFIVNSIRNRKSTALASKMPRNQHTLRLVIFLSSLLGLSWFFSVFVALSSEVIFQYIFAILNTLQGVFILIFHIFRSPDVRKAWSDTFHSVTKERKLSQLKLFSLDAQKMSRASSSSNISRPSNRFSKNIVRSNVYLPDRF